MDKLLLLDLLFATPSKFIGDDDTAETESETETEEKPPEKKPASTTKVKLDDATQKYVNSLLAEERRKGQAATNRAITELETLRNQSGTTESEKNRLAEQIEELRNQHVTEKELTAKELKKKEKAAADKLTTTEADRDKWKNLFFDTTIERNITDAALIPGQKAHNPKHVVNQLKPNARLVEELDEENRPTGKWITKAKIVTEKDGKPTVLDMTITEAVKFLSEQDEHAPLFDSGMTGGLGGNNRPRSKGGDNDPNTPPTDPGEYRVWRQKNPGSVGVNTKRSSK